MQGVGKETLIREPRGLHAHPQSVSSDGEQLIYEGEDDGTDLWAMHVKGDPRAHPVVQTPSSEREGTLSPDDRWLAYRSDLSGRDEIYVQGFPDPGDRTLVSSTGGSGPRWRRDGRELFYLAPNGSVMAVPVESAQPLRFGTPTALFQFYGLGGRGSFDVTPDGQRFIVRAVVRQSDPSLYALINWPSLLPK